MMNGDICTEERLNRLAEAVAGMMEFPILLQKRRLSKKVR